MLLRFGFWEQPRHVNDDWVCHASVVTQYGQYFTDVNYLDIRQRIFIRPYRAIAIDPGRTQASNACTLYVVQGLVPDVQGICFARATRSYRQFEYLQRRLRCPRRRRRDHIIKQVSYADGFQIRVAVRHRDDPKALAQSLERWNNLGE